MRISDWSSDVCSSDLTVYLGAAAAGWPGPKEKCRARRPGKLNREASRLGDVGPNAKWELRRKGPSPSGGRSELASGTTAGELGGCCDATSDDLKIEIGRASCRERESQYV